MPSGPTIYSGSQLKHAKHQASYPFLDWVFNGADIDRQKVLWERDMGAEKNEELLQYYSDRRVWLLEADDVPPRLLPCAEMPNKPTADVRDVAERQN